MPTLFLVKKKLKSRELICVVGLFVTLGLSDQVRADDSPSAATNAPAQTPPGATTQPVAGTDVKLPANASTTTTNVKPTAGTSTPTGSPPVQSPADQALSGLSIDELLNVTVTSAGQKEQKLSDVAAALAVITADDIERSGATNIPDLLRYVPGVEVGQTNNSQISVGIRGFGGVYNRKLLVLVDGRSIYDPLFGGADWQFQQMMMENIDRVEVIRGPGATVWGANAVDGVINIITKDSADTQGGLISTIYGTKDQGTGSFRYGLTPTQGLTLRVYGQYQNVDDSSPLPGHPKFDDGQNIVGGFRADYRPDSDDHYRLSSDVQTGHAGDALFEQGFMAEPAFNQTGDDENVNFTWDHNFEADNILTVQSYYDRFARNSDPTAEFIKYSVQTADFQIRHSLPINLLPIKQELIYGAEYREVSSELEPTNVSFFSSRGRDDQTFSAFAQTDLHLIDNVLTLTMGTKVDHNDYTGFEVQPSARLLWKIDNKNSVWAAVSRAVREPATAEFEETGGEIGNTNLKSEELIAYELGYRVQPVDWLSVDIDAFYNNYTNLIEPIVLPGTFVGTDEQFQKAQTYGIEPSFTAQVQPWWKVTGNYSFLSFHSDNSGVPPGATYSSAPLESVDPTNQFSLRNSFDLPHHISIDVGGRFVDKTAGANGYFAVDTRVAWKPTDNWEVAVVGQNLLAANHVENTGRLGDAVYVGPEVYAKVTFKF